MIDPSNKWCMGGDMRFQVTLHVDVPDDETVDAREIRGWLEEVFEEAEDDDRNITIVSCEEVDATD